MRMDRALRGGRSARWTSVARAYGAMFTALVAGLGLTADAIAFPGSQMPRLVAGIGVPGSCDRPYSDTSPWNQAIGSAPRYEADSVAHIAAIDGPLTSDPTQFTAPVYFADEGTARPRVKIQGWYSNVRKRGSRLVNRRGGNVRIPVPLGAAPSVGDQQIVVIDRSTGTEWGASSFTLLANGTWSAQNVYHYNVCWNGAPPRSTTGGAFVNPGLGGPYVGGLVRPCEIAQGRIDHALAFAYDGPTASFLSPATKSDGDSQRAADLPEGARLQLDPGLTDADLQGLGCDGACLVVAHALQEYGMYVVDGSGRSKLFFEFDGTAAWNGLVTESTVSPIPVAALRVLELGKLVEVDPGGVRLRRARVRAPGTLRAVLPITLGRSVARKKLAPRCSASIGPGFLKVVDEHVILGPRKRSAKVVCEWGLPLRAAGRIAEGFVAVLHPKGGTQGDFEVRVKRA